MKQINSSILDQLIAQKHLEDVDLSNDDVNGKDLSGCNIINVVFSKEKQADRVISNVNFKNAKLKDIYFVDAKLENIQFDNAIMEGCSFQNYNKNIVEPTIKKVSFAETIMNKCRFRDTIIEWSDF